MQRKIHLSLVLVILAMLAIPVCAQLPVPMFEIPTLQQEDQMSPAPENDQPGNQVQTATGPLVSSLQQSARSPTVSSSPEARARPVQGLRGRAEGTIYSLSANSAGQVSVYLNGQPSGPFSLQLQNDNTLAASQAILDLLLYAFENDQAVNIGYGSSNEIIEVEMIRSAY
jgi:hypothetical protein